MPPRRAPDPLKTSPVGNEKLGRRRSNIQHFNTRSRFAASKRSVRSGKQRRRQNGKTISL